MRAAAAAAEQLDTTQQHAEPALVIERDPWHNAWLLAVAAAGLGWALQVRDGLYDPLAFVGLTIALAATLAVFVVRSWPAIDRLGDQPLRWVFGVALAANFLQWFTKHQFPGSWHGPPVVTPFLYVCLALAALISTAMVWRPEHARLLLLPLIAVFCVAGGWMIHQVPQPYMDVWMLQTEGLKAFVAGHNPFANAFPDIYRRPELYGPGAIHADGLVHLGFPYPPMVLWTELPGFLMGGDYRWSNVGAMALTALLIAYSGRTRVAPLAAALFLFTPRALFVLESGWTEPTTALLLAATIFCAARVPKLMPVCLGLFLCSKQYLIWAIPPVILLAGRPTDGWRLVRILIVAAIAGCAVSLPLILWDVKAYLAANVDVAGVAAFRMDALSYLALWANKTHVIPSARAATLIGFGAAAAATVLVCLRGRRTPAGYAAAVALAHMVFFAFNKFAFCNYDWFLLAALCLAAAALRPEGHEDRSGASLDAPHPA